MNKLLIISVGPIQEFIASARKTSDLWYGSRLLSNISKKIAESVQKQSGKLIFPESTEANSIANIILAEIPESVNPKDIYEQAKQAGLDKWKEIAKEVLNKYKDKIDENLYEKQVEDAIEFYAAAVPIKNSYQEARKKLMEIFDGRKALRDFKYFEGSETPKSSLDGKRENVLKEGCDIQGIIKDNEKLCAIGLIKRIQGGSQRNCPSVSKITADFWIREVNKKSSELLQDFQKKCEKYRSPFDYSFLFEDRYSQLIKEGYINEEQSNTLKLSLKELTEKYGKIYPYFAILKADGDNMGKAISNIADVGKHRDFSKKLAEFSVGVNKIVEDNNGVCVYAGGDDVFAFLPLANALNCAKQLRESFVNKVSGATLSVGISVGHFMTPMEDLRSYAEDAEKLAKNNDDDDESKRKDGIAILINPRNGGKFHVRKKWDEKLVDKIEEFIKLFVEKKLPSKLPYDLRTLATSLKYRKIDGEHGTNRTEDKNIIENEIKILLKRKNTEIVEIINDKIEKIEKIKDLFTFAEEMLVAQWFAMAQQVKEDK